MTDEGTGYPWNWEGLSRGQLEANWRDLAEWVDWLQETYSELVKLPPCWPRHVPLRTELALFRYWHALAFEGTPHPAEALRWQRELRQAAETWRQLSDCRHEPPLRYESRLAEQRREQVAAHLRAVMSEPLWRNAEEGESP